MKRVVSTLLLLILLTATFGTFFSFAVQRQIARVEMRKAIKEEKKKHVSIFKFTKAEFAKLQLLDGGKEFLLQGGMYDITQKELTGEWVILHAFFDHKETSILDKFIHFFDEEENGKNGKNWVSHLFLPEFIAVQQSMEITLGFNILKVYHSVYPLHNTTVAIQIPPPDIQV
jgi:hypothetical protein